MPDAHEKFVISDVKEHIPYSSEHLKRSKINWEAAFKNALQDRSTGTQENKVKMLFFTKAMRIYIAKLYAEYPYAYITVPAPKIEVCKTVEMQ